MRVFLLCLSAFLLSLLFACNESTNSTQQEQLKPNREAYSNGKPYVRWWWFATAIKKEDIKSQLNWANAKNIGGVEIAWVYPLYRYQRMYERKYGRSYPKDTTAQKWLSLDFVKMVNYTKSYADSIGLGCDFTFGSGWPAASGDIDPQYGSKIYGDSTFKQLLTFSWAWPDTFLVIDHLDSNAFSAFADPIANALSEAINKGSKSALFTDSWEIKLNTTNKIWTDGFEKDFLKRFDYDLLPYMNKGLDSFPDVRYDYMQLLEEKVINGFYKPYVRKCRELGALSRVQCLASPTNVMTTYSLVDIPETESMLNNPNYSRIVSSSACLASKPIVSSETFTCMYGFPATYLREEQTADLKMVADAMFANGVNQHVYHGMPYNPKGSDSIDFFATTYFGPGGSLEPELADFNQYIANVSSIMRKGKTYSDVAVYLPYEDAVMKGAYPPERQRVWVWGEYEMRYVEIPEELEGYHPLWINGHFLKNSEMKNGKLHVGDAQFSLLYVDVKYMDIKSLKRIYELSLQGLRICLKSEVIEPGKKKSADYQFLLNKLKAQVNVSEKFDLIIDHPALLAGEILPAYWCKVRDDGTHAIFLAQAKSKDLKYPVYSGQSYMRSAQYKELSLYVNDSLYSLNIEFKPYQSVVLSVSPDGKVEQLEIEFIPKQPEIKPVEKQKMYF